MIKPTLFVAFMLCCIYTFAQNPFSISPTAFEESLYNANTEFNQHVLISTMQNEGATDIEMEWALADLNIPVGWEVSIADNEVEYFSSVSSSPNPFTLLAGDTSSNFRVFVSTYGTNGCGSFTINYKNFNTQEIVQSVNYLVGVDDKDCITTSTTLQQIPNLSIGPNPAEDYFTLSSIEGLAQLSIYDTQGRLQLSKNMISSAEIDIAELSNGVYFINIIDKERRVSTFKLIKTY